MIEVILLSNPYDLGVTFYRKEGKDIIRWFNRVSYFNNRSKVMKEEEISKKMEYSIYL
jgi:hypothetical protein